MGHRTMLVALLALGLTSIAGAQDERPTAERADRAERAEVDPGRLEALVQRRLEQIERQEARLREIRERLDKGEPPAAIMADLRERGEMGLLMEGSRGGDRDGQRGGREGAERDPQELSPEDFVLWRNRVMAFFERHAPEMAQRLREEGDSEHARRAILRLRREVDRLIELREQGSDEFQPALDRLRNGVRIADVLGRVRAAAVAGTLTPEILRDHRRDLTEVVARQYDAQLDARAQWLEKMGQRLRGAVEKLERERAERSQRIEAEVQAMLDRAISPRDEHEGDGPPRRGPR